MSDAQLPDPATPIGRRVRERLQREQIIWLTQVAPSGTPQPNPVWFCWNGSEVVIYNYAKARRLTSLRDRPRVSLNFNADATGDDVIVLTGRAVIDPELPAAHAWPDYVAKYGEAMARISGSLEAFGERYSVATRVSIDRVRGF